MISVSSRPWVFGFALCAVVASLSACDDKKEEGAKAKPTEPAEPETSKAPGQAAEAQPAAKPAPVLGHRFPVGPRLVFLPGQGVGPIRFGATVETIERHMEAPCDFQTESRCVYVRAAVEFYLKDGLLTGLKAYRRDRPVPSPAANKEKYFGSLRGIVQPRIMLGLHRHIVVEEFGQPKEKHPVDPPGPDGLVDRHVYDGIIFEYDKIENGNTVLSTIEIVPSDSPHQAKPAKPASPKQPAAPNKPALPKGK